MKSLSEQIKEIRTVLESQGTLTPWGRSDWEKQIAPGIVLYTTPSHGGIHVDAQLNKKMPDKYRIDDGWYEEDVEYALVVLAFPQHFSAKELANAQRIFDKYFADRKDTKSDYHNGPRER